jgi:hypothetical protein
MINFKTAQDFIDNFTGYLPVGSVVSFNGNTEVGDGGHGRWIKNAVTGTPSQSPTDLINALLNDADGNQWEMLSTTAYLEEFGGGGDWNGSTGTDNSAALIAALASRKKIKFTNGKRYMFSNPVAVTNTDVNIDFNEAEIIQNGDFDLLSVEQDFTDIQVVSSFNKSALIDLTNGDIGSDTRTTAITVEDGSAYTKGDIVKIYSDDFIAGVAAANKERKGEFAKVAGVDGDEVYFFSQLRENYATNVRLAKMSDQYRVRVVNGIFDHDGSINPTYSGSVIHLTGCFEPELVNLHAKRTRSEFVELDACFGAKSFNITAKQLTTSFANFAYGYVLVEYACEAGLHIGLKGWDARHVYTDGTRSTEEDDTRVSRYGSTRSVMVVNGYGFNSQNASFDTHYSARGGLFIGCISELPYNGPNGTQLNYQLRGVGASILDCRSFGGRGYRINGAYDELGAGRDNSIIDCHHSFISTANQNLPAVEVTGPSDTNRVTGARIINLTTDQLGGSSMHYLIENAEVEIINPQARMKFSSDGFGEIVRVIENSNVVVDGGSLNYDGSSGLYMRPVRILDGNSQVVMLNTRINGLISHICDMSSEDSTFICKNIQMTVAPQNESGVTDEGAGHVSIDYLVNHGVTANRAVFAVTYAAAGNKAVDLEYRGAPRLFLSVTADQIATRITTITNGAFIGQTLTVQSAFDSTNSIFIYTGAILINANIEILQGQSYTLMWNGSAWTSG